MERFGQPEGARSGRAGERAAGREAALQAARQNERLTVFLPARCFLSANGFGLTAPGILRLSPH